MTELAGKQCTGCAACINICPSNCIELAEQNGHLKTRKHLDLCIGCNRCRNVCPVIKKQYSKAFASYALDELILNSSSSGGIAPLLAESVISRGGVVFGAAFDTDFSVYHMAVEEKKQLDKIRRSKYVQSRIGNSYQTVADYLLNGREVLFTGTGCQINGLLSYLSEKKVNSDKLYTQDIICHGVVLPKVWNKYLQEKEDEYKSKIVEISFRDKRNGWLNFGMRICFENGQVYYMDNKDDIYMKIFLSNICLNESCYDCQFRGEERVSDITLADFWSVYRIAPECFNEKGTSLVLVHSQKGEKLLNSISKRIFIKEVNLHDVTRSETMLVTTVRKHAHRNRFLELLEQKPLEQAFSQTSYARFGIIGSYNSRCIAKRCGKVLFQVSNTNLVSLFAKPVANDCLKVKDNAFREEMLKLDFEKTFIADLGSYLKEVEYFMVDFLEERFGVLEVGDSYIAMSDALKDAEIDVNAKRIICVSDSAYFEKWKECCRRFIEILSENLHGKKLILVKMYLAERDSLGNYFPEVDEIRKINLVLDSMYLFFQKQAGEVGLPCGLVEIAKPLLYTNHEHHYGCCPEHFNVRAELMGAAIVNGMISKWQEI